MFAIIVCNELCVERSIQIKRKSLKSYRTEELGACEGGKEEQKALLAKWFEETYSHYRKLLLGMER